MIFRYLESTSRYLENHKFSRYLAIPPTFHKCSRYLMIKVPLGALVSVFTRYLGKSPELI